jgi:ABC-type transporter Mla maintaining outer membrane lipid asymmetry ATPase subunit MlaF
VLSERERSPSGSGASLLDASAGERELHRALAAMLTSPSPVVNRLSYARTSVTFRVTGGHSPVTLLLDRRPPELAGADEPAEIELELTPRQAIDLAHGLLALPAAILRGDVSVRGPVRKYLEVEPMVRALLLAAGGEAPSGSNGERPQGDRPRTVFSDDAAAELLSIETRELHKGFGSHQVLQGVVSVVLGPSGTGKSVLLQHIIGLMRADSGDVLVRGRPLSRMSRSQILALRTEIGVMFQDGALFSTMNLYDNVAFPLRQHTKLGESQIREVVMDHLSRVGLSDAAKRMPNQLSGGMRKRAGLARALVLDPGVVLCDEPDSGLDPVRTALLGELLLEQHAQLGGTILVITHNVALAKRISDHISILWQGRVIESEMTEAILESDNEFVRQFLRGETDGPLGMD